MLSGAEVTHKELPVLLWPKLFDGFVGVRGLSPGRLDGYGYGGLGDGYGYGDGYRYRYGDEEGNGGDT